MEKDVTEGEITRGCGSDRHQQCHQPFRQLQPIGRLQSQAKQEGDGALVAEEEQSGTMEHVVSGHGTAQTPERG